MFGRPVRSEAAERLQQREDKKRMIIGNENDQVS